MPCGRVCASDAGGLGMMKVLGSRVDALTIAYRVDLDPAFVALLKQRGGVAREHGRAALEWIVRAPDDDGDGTIAARRRVGPLRLRWADEVDRVQHVEKLWGELRYSNVRGRWVIVNEPFWRVLVCPSAPGGGGLRDCPRCKGAGKVRRPGKPDEVCEACGGSGAKREPGWTLEVVWYAQALADSGLERAMAESAALAANLGEVLETRLRRIDLCADVTCWEFQDVDLSRIAKRSRAAWAKDDDGVPSEGDLRPRKRRSPRERVEDGGQVYGRGVGETRRITGISVGRGGSLMCRMYDKRVELERDQRGARREAEEERWREAGWNGIDPVTRIEFQLRSEVLTELGLRDPDAVVEPVYRAEKCLDARGRWRVRRVVVGHRVLTAQNDEGGEVQATIVHRLDDLWHACLNWVRIITPETTREGNPKPLTRCPDDPRWALLRSIRFTDQKPRRIRRYRPRAAASWQMGLGVALSQAAALGELEPAIEDRFAYDDDERGEAALREWVTRLKVSEAERIARGLIERWGGPAAALEHLAVRANAARARFHHGVEADPEAERGPPHEARRAVA